MHGRTEKRIGIGSLISYGMGDIYGGGSFLIISTLFIYFLTDMVGLSPLLAGLVVLEGKAWDAISDPLMGLISDRTKSRFGRRRVYFLASIIPIFITLFCFVLGPLVFIGIGTLLAILYPMTAKTFYKKILDPRHRQCKNPFMMVVTNR